MAMPDSIPPAVKQILDLFARELANLTFGDLDRRVLDEAATRVTEQAEAVARAEAALDAARAQLAESQEALASRAARALSHARIHAEDDAALSARLEAITPPRPASGRRLSIDSSPLAGGGQPAPARQRSRRRDTGAAPALFTRPDGEAQPAAS